MLYSSLFQYIETIIEKEDTYDLDVLYFCLRKTFTSNHFSFEDVKVINISQKFYQEAITIEIENKYSTQLESVALLMAVRGLQLNKELFPFYKSDNLFFLPQHSESFEWIQYATIILKYRNDADFYNLYCMLEGLYYDGKFSQEDKTDFFNNTKVPPFKNIRNYYRDIAGDSKQKNKNIIVDNAYIGDDFLIELTLPYNVEYIGNTAIAFCKNLKRITIKRPNLKFGKFPIIECTNLQSIIVPEGRTEYYKIHLPFYKSIIFSESEEPHIHPTAVDKNNKPGTVLFVPQNEQDTEIKEDQVKNITIEEEEEKEKHNAAINTKKIQEIFKYKSTTYKFFWFMAILDIVKNKEELNIPFHEILAKMIALAWPLAKDKISFGTTDNLHSIIQSLILTSTIGAYDTDETIEKKILKNYDADATVHKILTPLTKNVPFRFLSPWIKYTNDRDVMEASQNTECLTPYALFEDYILLDEEWFDYFLEDYDNLFHLAKNELIKYLKTYNDNFTLLKYMVD